MLMLWMIFTTIDIFSHCRFLASTQGKIQAEGFEDEFISAFDYPDADADADDDDDDREEFILCEIQLSS